MHFYSTETQDGGCSSCESFDSVFFCACHHLHLMGKRKIREKGGAEGCLNKRPWKYPCNFQGVESALFLNRIIMKRKASGRVQIVDSWCVTSVSVLCVFSHGSATPQDAESHLTTPTACDIRLQAQLDTALETVQAILNHERTKIENQYSELEKPECPPKQDSFLHYPSQ